MRVKSLSTAALCILLVFLTLLRLVSPALAAEQPIYIKEIVTSTGETGADAKKWLTQNGYTVVDNDLNAGTDEDPVYLGFKTTTKKSEAITDISLMSMEGGYEMMDYAAFAAQNQANIAEMVSELRTACREMKAKLDSGSPAAKTALAYLNIFTVPEANQPLGDYLMDSGRTDGDYRMILLVCNSLVTNIIYTQLALGCSDYGEKNWAQRMSEAGPDESFRGDDYSEYWGEQFDLYYDKALDLYKILGVFRDKYISACERRDANGGEVSVLDATEEEAAEAVENFAATGQCADESAEDAFVLSVMEYLNTFGYSSDKPLNETEYSQITVKAEYINRIKFDGENAYYIKAPTGGYGAEPEYELIPFDAFIENYANCTTVTNSRLFPLSDKLGDVLMEIAAGEENEENISLLYPMVQALTPAQNSLLCVEGLLTFTKLMLTDETALNTLNESLPEYRDNLYKALDSDTASVWIGTNRDIYNSKIALTNEARRNAAAANDYQSITEVTEFDTDIRVCLCYIGGAASAAAGVTLVALGIGAFVFKGIAATIVAGMITMGGAISATVSGVAFGCVGCIGICVSALLIAALVVCAIVYAVDYLIDLYNYYNPEYTEIPSIMVDMSSSGYVIYHAVTSKGGKNADINVWEGKKWNALYWTRDTGAGSPLVLDANGSCFKVVYGSTKVPEGMVPVTFFGETSAKNLNTDDYDDDVGGIYLYYRAESEEPTAEETPTEGRAYIESMAMLCGEESSAVKALLKIKGYNIIDFNLTSDTDFATFIGYTTTTNSANAITDIRVSYGGSDGKYYFGDITDSYGCAGSNSVTTEGESTGLMTSLYYTKSKNRGTPIYDSLIVLKGTETPIGYEPVNLFSGGGAFDFNTYPEESPSEWKNHAYIYFEPSVYYNESNSELYLGGIGFVSGSTDMDAGKLENYVTELGLTLYNYNLTGGFTDDEDRTWLCYSTTYNPYRAIYDIGVYTAEYKSQFLPEALVLDCVGYVSAQTFTQGDRNYYGNVLWGGHYRLIRPTHAYISNEEDYGGDDEYGDTLVCNRGMYVCGPETGKEPIKMTNFKISRTSEIPAGSVAVHDMTDKFATTALNLALYDGDRKNSLYITYNGVAPVKQKYISKITVVKSTAEDISYDKTMYKLMACGGDEIIKVNLAETDEDSWVNKNYAAGFDEDSDRDDYEDSVAYIRITRTKTKNDAIGSVIMVQKNGTPEATITARYDDTDKTAQFTLAGDGISYCEGTKYYLYYSKSGEKINDFTVNKTAVEDGKITVLNPDKKLLTNVGFYFHTYSDANLPYYSLIRIASGNSDMDVVKSLLSAGCTQVKKISQSGKAVYMGYARTSSAVRAIRNIVVSKNTADTLTVGEFNYKKCGTVGGNTIYSTVEGVKTKAITYIDFGGNTPNSQSYPVGTVFEYVQTDGAEKADIAASVGAKGYYYIYISHKDNSSFTDKAYFASVFVGNFTLTTIIVMVAILFGAGGVVLVVKKRREGREAKNDRDKS